MHVCEFAFIGCRRTPEAVLHQDAVERRSNRAQGAVLVSSVEVAP